MGIFFSSPEQDQKPSLVSPQQPSLVSPQQPSLVSPQLQQVGIQKPPVAIQQPGIPGQQPAVHLEHPSEESLAQSLEEPENWRIDSKKNWMGFNIPVLRTGCAEVSIMGFGIENDLGVFGEDLEMENITPEHIIVNDIKNKKKILLKRKKACENISFGAKPKITIHNDVDATVQDLVQKLGEPSQTNFKEHYFDQNKFISFLTGGGNYKNIIDPISKKSYSLKSRTGKKILKGFLDSYHNK